MIYKVLLSLWLLVLLSFFSCDDGNPVQDNRSDNLELQRDTLTAVASQFIRGGKVSTAFSNKLLLGAAYDYSARFLLKFGSLPDSIKTINKAAISLRTFSSLGQTNSQFIAQLYRVTANWKESVNSDNSWDYNQNISTDPVTSKQFTVASYDSIIEIQIPDTLVSIWTDTVDTNFGLLADFTQADYIHEFYSSNSNTPPKLILHYLSKSDSSVFDTLNATQDASIIDYGGTLQSDSLIFISSGYTHHSFVRFNLDSIPDNAILSYADFRFFKDQQSSFSDTLRSHTFYVRVSETAYEQLPSFTLDSTFLISRFYDISVEEKGTGEVRIIANKQGEAGKYFLQSLLDDRINYGSFYLSYTNEGYDISVYAIKGTEGIVERFKPQLIIEYYLIPPSRI